MLCGCLKRIKKSMTPKRSTNSYALKSTATGATAEKRMRKEGTSLRTETSDGSQHFLIRKES